MMRLVPILVLLALTNPRGAKFYIDSESIVAIAPGLGYCTPDTLTRLDVGTNNYCVRESMEDVAAAIKGAADDASKEKAGE